MSKPRLTEQDYENASVTCGCEVAAIKAVADVESAGDGFDTNDNVKVLFERHLFHKYTHGRFDASHPDLSNPSPGGYGAGGEHQYARFSEAFALDPNAAMMATSWGKFQILGANFAICGYASVGEFVDAMKEGEGPQLEAFCEFVIHNHLDDDLTSHNWAGFARGYNGGSYRKNNYDGKMAAAYAHFKAHPVSAAPPMPNPPSLPESSTTGALASGPSDVAEPDVSSPPIKSEPSPADVPPLQQQATNIINSGDIAPPAPPTQNLTAQAPPAESSVAKSAGMTIAGIAVPSCLVGIVKVISDAISNGFVNAADVGTTVIGFVKDNTKYVFILIGAVIVLLGVKHVTKHVTLWIEMFTKSRTDLNSVTVVPAGTPEQSSSSIISNT